MCLFKISYVTLWTHFLQTHLILSQSNIDMFTVQCVIMFCLDVVAIFGVDAICLRSRLRCCSRLRLIILAKALQCVKNVTYLIYLYNLFDLVSRRTPESGGRARAEWTPGDHPGSRGPRFRQIPAAGDDSRQVSRRPLDAPPAAQAGDTEHGQEHYVWDPALRQAAGRRAPSSAGDVLTAGGRREDDVGMWIRHLRFKRLYCPFKTSH